MNSPRALWIKSSSYSTLHSTTHHLRKDKHSYYSQLRRPRREVRAHALHNGAARKKLPRLIRSRRLSLVLNQDQGCLRCIELAPALGFRGLEGAVGLRTCQAHRFWSVAVITERRMIPGFLSLRKGKPDLTARPTPIPTQLHIPSTGYVSKKCTNGES